MIDLKACFEKYEDEFLKFDRVESPASKRSDLHAFMLLDKLIPGTRDMVSAAEHDEIWLGIDCEALAVVITEGQVCELRRCGVMYSSEYESLSLYV